MYRKVKPKRRFKRRLTMTDNQRKWRVKIRALHAAVIFQPFGKIGTIAVLDTTFAGEQKPIAVFDILKDIGSAKFEPPTPESHAALGIDVTSKPRTDRTADSH